MIIDGYKLSSKKHFSCDICIIGAGVAGITLANELLDTSSLTITLVESGDEIYKQETQDLYSPEKKPDLYEDPTYNRLRLLGGSSNHWQNNTSPLDPIDFESRDWIPNSGWPISYKDIEPYYIKAAEYCGTKSDKYNLEYWSKTLNSTDLFKQSKIIETNIAKAATPPTRFFNEHGHSLKISQKITLLKNTNLVDLDYDLERQRVKEVSVSAKPGLIHTIDAKVFILCAGGIENARLMLEFNQKFNNKLGNQHSNVGRYFMDHPIIRPAILYPNKQKDFSLYQHQIVSNRAVSGFMQFSSTFLKENKCTNLRMPLNSQNEYEASLAIESLHMLSDNYKQNRLEKHFGKHILNILSDLDMVLEGASRKSLNKSLFDSASDFEGYKLPIMIEQTPNRNNRIKLGTEEDRFGLRKILIDWELGQFEIDNLWRILPYMSNEIGRLNLGRIRLLKEFEDRLFGRKMYFSHHHMGTTRMANSPVNGVVDKNLKVFTTKNLYISSSSIFTTGGHLPPTLTIAAFSVRLAKHIKEKFA